MDSFIKVVDQKKDPPVTTIHIKQIDLVRRYINEGKNVFICGAAGVGKSYILKSVLQDTKHVELQSDHLKSKSPFMAFIKNSTKHVFIEDYDPIFKPVIQSVSDGNPLSRGSLIVTSTNMCMYPNFTTVFIQRHKPDVLLKLTDKTGLEARNAAIRANGNIEIFFKYLDGYDEMDDFQTPKEFIAEILSETGPLEIYDSVSEHGHLWDIFQENYLDSKGVDILKASESFSDADRYDGIMYSQGDWNLMPYFILHSLTIPKSALGIPLRKDQIRPGRCWTKFRNFKMRQHKVEDIKKKSRLGLGVEELCLLKRYAEIGELEPLVSYNITPQDFDIINHLAVGNGLKSRDVTRVKKALKNAYG
jgi:ABC-type oligopeptide transport system ATPase subunit